MSYPEHLKAALAQLEEHLLQSWQISLEDLRFQNETLQGEIARQYEEILQLREQTPLPSSSPATDQAPQRNLKAEELEQEIQGLQALYSDSQDRRSEMSEQLAQLREQLELEAAQSARLTLEMVDLKLEQERERHRLRGLPTGPPKFNLPDLVEEEKPQDQNDRHQQDGHTLDELLLNRVPRPNTPTRSGPARREGCRSGPEKNPPD